MKNTNVEVEGGEILIQSKEGHYAVIPAKDRKEVMGMVKGRCNDCINSYIQGLPKESDYAEDGTLIANKDSKPTNVGYNWSSEGANQGSNYNVKPTNYSISHTESSNLTPKQLQDLKKHTETQAQEKLELEYNQRVEKIEESIKAQKQPLSADNIKTETQSTGDKFSIAMNTKYGNPAQYPRTSEFLNTVDYVNPAKWLGDMVTGVGAFPHNIKEGNYGQAALGLGIPLVTGALGGIGAKSTGQFVNNLANPFAGMGKSKATSSVDDVGKYLTQTSKPAWQMEEIPGLHLKSTMEGQAISKIVEPKTGLVNVEQALGIIGKESGGAEKVAMIRKGLGDKLPQKMDYNEFRKVTQDQLIPLERQFSEQASNYGIGKLGYPSPKNSSFQSAIKHGENQVIELEKQINNIKSLKESPDGGKLLTSLTEDLKQAKINLDYNQSMLSKLPLENQTLILGNKSKFGRGSSAHGNPDETLGHAHFLRDAETPDVLTVTQIQSDAFQGTHRRMPKGKLTKTNDPIDDDYIDEIGKYFDKATGENFAQKSLLDKNHQERYLQELVDYAGKRGDVKKVRVPTSETAAKVQGYSKLDPEVDPERIAKIKRQIEQGKKKVLEASSEDKIKWERGVKSLELELQGGYEFQHQTILKKYSEQPKTIKKLFGEEPKIVTDSKGNTWYEFDIPDKAKKGKMEIKAFTTTGAAIGTGTVLQKNNKTKTEE